MRIIVAVFSVCIVLVHGQARPPRPPPSGGPQGTPVPLSAAADAPAQTSPPRPKGCSPGCGPTEICAELGASYCRGGQVCSVCIKMSSIRFPASALAGMFQAQQPTAPTVPAQPVMPTLPPSNALKRAKNDKEISIIEYAAQHRKSVLNEGADIQNGNFKPPRPPSGKGQVDYDVVTGTPADTLQEGPSLIDRSTTTAPYIENIALDINNIDSQTVKYPIIVRVPGSPRSPKSNVKVDTNTLTDAHDPYSTTPDEHMAHIDHSQMQKWYQQYLQFRAEQASINQRSGVQSGPAQPADNFDYASFQQFQNWLQHHSHEQNMQPQPVVRTTPMVPAYPQQPIMTVQQPMQIPVQPNHFNYANIPQQHQNWQLQHQNQAQTLPTAQGPISYDPMQQQFQQFQLQQQQSQHNQFQTGNVPYSPIGPTANVPNQPNTFDSISFQQRFLDWQLQQHQRQQQNQLPPQLGQSNVAIGNVGLTPSQGLAVNPVSQPSNTLDSASLQQQFLDWQRQQRQPTQQPQFRDLGQAQTAPDTKAAQDVNVQQTQAVAAQQENQTNTQQNAQSASPQENTVYSQENTVAYLPQQQPANNFNDPFNFFNFDPLPQQNALGMNNNMFGLMMFDGMGFGGGFGF